MGGIYEIRQRGTNRRYVGSTTDFVARWKQHRTHLLGGRHTNHILQNIWNKHGCDALEFVIVERCENAELLRREQIRIDEIWGKFECLNLCPTAGVAGKRGVSPSIETRAKISAAISGSSHAPPSAATRAKIAAAHRGTTRTDEAKANMRAGAKGRKMPPRSVETVEKMKAGMRAAWIIRKARDYGGHP